MPEVSPNDSQPALVVVALSVLGDPRPLPELQPPLPEGIHLRWAFPRDKGFPWYGFYLFRRLTPPSGTQMTCASSQFTGLTPGPRPSTDLPIALGTFHSDQNLVLTDSFAPTGTVEIDLSGRQFVEFRVPPTNPSSLVEVSIGFVSDFPAGGSGPGTGGSPGTGGIPGTAGGVGSATGAAADCACGCAHEAVRPIAEKVVALGPGQFAATFGFDNTGHGIVSLPIGRENSFFPAPADRGQPTLFRPGRQTNVFSVVFDGRPLAWRLAGQTVTVSGADAGSGSGGSGGSGGGGPTTADGILVTALLGNAVIATGVAAGRAGEVKVVRLAFDAIDTIRVTSGPARIVDVCVRSASAGAGQGWAPVPSFPQPMLLPVQHANYPLQTGTGTADDSRARALPRIRYAFPVSPPTTPPTLDKTEWSNDQSFVPFFETLSKTVSVGPSHITDLVETVFAPRDPNDPDATPPSTAQSSLELLLGAAVNPAVAQMLGLSWIDDTVVEGQSYDYVLVADYTNVANGNLQTVQALVTANNYAQLTAYKRQGVLHAAGSSLPAPQGLAAYDLPIGGVPANAPGDVAGQVGLTWTIPTISPTDTRLARDASILYHVWRHDYGRDAPATSADDLAYQRITPLPVAAGVLRTQGTQDVLQGWPAVNLFAFDGPLVEGWYGYRVSGIDLFGRHSKRSSLPAPWANAGTIQIGDPSIAVHIMDTTPPPAPTAVQAWMLEPGDDFVIQDTPYTQWRTRVGASQLGLRVRWIWTGKQMRQAPDTKEFRIYVQSGSSMANAASIGSWLRRVAVVAFGEAVHEALVPLTTAAGTALSGSAATASGPTVTLSELTDTILKSLAIDALELELPTATGGRTRFQVLAIDASARQLTLDAAPQLGVAAAWNLGIVERTYEVFLPQAGLAAPEDFVLPWAPTAQTAVAYGMVGVSAADDKNNERAVDVFDTPATRGPLVPRAGNEGAVGGPATVVQVLRDKPVPPTLPIDQATLQATRADFNSRSFFNLHYPRAADLLTHVYRAVDESLIAVDKRKRFPTGGGSSVSPTSAVTAGDLGWTQAGRFQNAANQLTALTADTYGGLSPDALRLLASLPSNAEAFTCLTASPLAADRPDLLGRNDDKTYQISATLSSYEDTLDGRATNVYFYRTAKVNNAHTPGDLGVSTPPVLLPTAAGPDAPVLTDAGGGDHSVRVSWQSSVDPTVTEYRIYRAATESDVRTLADTNRIFTLAEPRPPASRPPVITKTDLPAEGGKRFFYAVTAAATTVTDPVGRESGPSRVAALTAFDDTRPTAPDWLPPQSVTGGLRLRWTTSDTSLVRFLVQRRQPPSTDWTAVSPWLDASARDFIDDSRGAGTPYEYRLLVFDDRGRINRDFKMVTG